MGGWALKIQPCHLVKSTTKPPLGNFILSAARLAVRFWTHAAHLPSLGSDLPTWLRQQHRCSWAFTGGLVPKKCTASMGLGGWCWGDDTSMSSQRTHCRIGISYSENFWTALKQAQAGLIRSIFGWDWAKCIIHCTNATFYRKGNDKFQGKRLI